MAQLAVDERGTPVYPFVPEEEVNPIQDMKMQDAMSFCWLASFLSHMTTGF